MSFSATLLVDAFLTLVAMGLYGFGAYRAVGLRRILVAPAYRSLAIWTGVVGFLVLPYGANLLLKEAGAGSAGGLYQAFFVAFSLAGALSVFFWIDRAIKLGLSLDFFHRDIAYWQKGARYLTWGVLTLLVVLFFVAGLGYVEPFVFAVAGYSVAVLAVSTWRARDDMLLDFLRWVALVILGAMAASEFSVLVGLNFLQLVPGYFFYRAGGALSGSTYHFELSSFFEAPRDYVYSVYTDPSMLAKITRSYRSAGEAEKKQDGTEVVKVEANVLGMKVPMTLKRRYFPPGGMQEEVISKSGNGATRFAFVPEGEGTTVSASVDIEPKGALTKLFGGLGARAAQRQFEDDFKAGKAYCEANKPGHASTRGKV